MSSSKRTIRGEQYNITQIVTDAIATVDASTPATEAAAQYLAHMGHTAPAESLIGRVAREMAILAILERQTGAAFNGQIGKISFDDQATAIRQANAYLDRRNAGHRSRWNK